MKIELMQGVAHVGISIRRDMEHGFCSRRPAMTVTPLSAELSASSSLDLIDDLIRHLIPESCRGTVRGWFPGQAAG
jgi:hypothetical protein